MPKHWERVIRTFLVLAVLVPAAIFLGFAVTFTIGWGMEWPYAGYLVDAIWALIIAGVAWAAVSAFRSVQP